MVSVHSAESLPCALQEEDNVDVEGWVGSLTCNYCEGHVLSFRGASQDGG